MKWLWAWALAYVAFVVGLVTFTYARLPAASAVVAPKTVSALATDVVSKGLTPTLAMLLARADGGDNRAQRELGWRYHVGDGVPRNDAAAIKWLLLANTLGNERAGRELAQVRAGATPTTVTAAHRAAGVWWLAHHNQ